MVKKVKGGDTKVTLIKQEDGNLKGAISSKAVLAEDAFASLYYNATTGHGVAISPPYDPARLLQFEQENNTLAQCVSAMEVNIDGTGHVIEPKDDKVEAKKDPNIEALDDFFMEPYPGESFVTQRRKMRRELEITGNAYLEVIRNPADEIVFVRPIDVTTIRILRLGNPVPVEKVINRRGSEVKLKVLVRERIYVQMIGSTTIYFKEYGASRDVDREKGVWSAKGQRLLATQRGSEVIHFTVNKDVATPYGVPRWINQLPSVVGSRRAEELNLSFFNNGGIPPALVIVQGGQFIGDSKKELKNIFGGGAASKNSAAIVEVHGTGGGIDSSGAVRVTVERFGAEKQKDCHDAVTEVLTSEGWVQFPELMKDIPIATLNPQTNKMEFKVPTELVAYDYSGEMIQIATKSVNMVVTPNHDLWRRTRKGRYIKSKAESYKGQQTWMTTAAKSTGVSKKVIDIPRYTKRVDTPTGVCSIPVHDLLWFMGLYIGEGCVYPPEKGCYNIRLGAKSEVKVKIFKDSALHIVTYLKDSVVHQHPLSKGGSSIEFSDKSLSLWLYSSIGHGAVNKRLPSWSLDLNAEQSDILLSSLYISDGSRCPGRVAWSYGTASKGLANDVQILALRCGHRATVSEDSSRYWRVNIVPDASEVCVSAKDIIAYDGRVYCVRVPNHLLFTRREGRVVVSGNSMFEKYDERSEKRVRSSFRLAPLFVGRAEDYTRATADTSYIVGEAQVFTPERTEFDEKINVTLMRGLDDTGEYKFRSLPIVVKDTETQLKAVELASKVKAITKEQLIEAINEMVNLNLKFDESLNLDTTSGGDLDEGGANLQIQKSDPFEILGIAAEYTLALGLDGHASKLSKEEFSDLKTRIQKLSEPHKELFDAIVAGRALTSVDADPQGASELCCESTKLMEA